MEGQYWRANVYVQSNINAKSERQVEWRGIMLIRSRSIIFNKF